MPSVLTDDVHECSFMLVELLDIRIKRRPHFDRSI